MTVRKRPAPPPAHLSDESKGIWRSVLAEYELDEKRHQAMLLVALEAFDRMREAQEAIRRDGAYIDGRFGKKAHPALAIERDSRTAFLRAQRELGLDLSADPPRSPTPWRP
jgi:P27 family predicted phage terminase small subunit